MCQNWHIVKKKRQRAITRLYTSDGTEHGARLVVLCRADLIAAMDPGWSPRARRSPMAVRHEMPAPRRSQQAAW
jgi:hypothetical protein